MPMTNHCTEIVPRRACVNALSDGAWLLAPVVIPGGVGEQRRHRREDQPAYAITEIELSGRLMAGSAAAPASSAITAGS
jgi:hypothetical protein